MQESRLLLDVFPGCTFTPIIYLGWCVLGLYGRTFSPLQHLHLFSWTFFKCCLPKLLYYHILLLYTITYSETLYKTTPTFVQLSCTHCDINVEHRLST